MKNEQKHIDEVILLRVLENRASEAEKKQFNNWLEASGEHREIYRQYQQTAELTSVDSNSLHDNWNAITKKAKSGKPVPEYIELPEARTHILGGFSRNLLRVAAAVVILIGISFLFNRIFLQPEQLMISGSNYDPETPYVLADGSRVYLNEDAVLTFQDNFGRKSRELSLDGEAFFEVQRNEDLPFILTAQHTTVRVLGTSFNVDSDSSRQVKVSVVSGEVEFSAVNTTTKLRLQPGEQGSYNPVLENIEKTTVRDQNFLSWKTGHFHFDNTSVREAFDLLETYYPYQLVYDDEAEDTEIPTLTTSVEDQPWDAVLEELNLLLNTTHSTRNDTIFFTPLR